MIIVEEYDAENKDGNPERKKKSANRGIEIWSTTPPYRRWSL